MDLKFFGAFDWTWTAFDEHVKTCLVHSQYSLTCIRRNQVSPNQQLYFDFNANGLYDLRFRCDKVKE